MTTSEEFYAEVQRRYAKAVLDTSIDKALEALNSALEADRDAVTKLLDYRVFCNTALADHPTIQVRPPTMVLGCTVGFLGIINGLFGVDENGTGHICSVYDADGTLEGFRRTKHTSTL